MKKALSILLSVLLVVLMFSGCAGEPGPLKICVDMAYAAGADNVVTDRAMYDLEYMLRDWDGIEDFEFEYIPMEGPERETALDRIRTELMSGGGPDVFMVNCAGHDVSERGSTAHAV